MRTPTLLAACLMVLLAFQSNAQVQKSDQNLGFGLDISSLGGDLGESRINLYATYTYYLSKNLSLGVGPRYGKTSSTTSDGSQNGGTQKNDVTTIGYNIFANYNMLTSGGFVLPYFGAQFTSLAQKRDMGSDINSTSVGGNIGVKFFITERFNVDNNFSLTRVLTSKSGGQTIDEDATVMQINVGLGYIIGRKN